MTKMIREIHDRVERSEVYAAINSERDYQDKFIEASDYHDVHVGGEFLTMLDTYLRRAQDKWTFHKEAELGDEEYLHEVRKIAAICVRCMEFHGAPKRNV